MPTHLNLNFEQTNVNGFFHSKLETKVQEFRKVIYLNGEIYDQNVTITTLQNARYSQRESDIVELWRKMTKLDLELNVVQTKLNVIQLKVEELQGKMEPDAEVLAEWQTASLVLCAYGVYMWNLVSVVDKANLSQYNICTYWDLYHARFGAPGLGRKLAWEIYSKFDANLGNYVESLRSRKGIVGATQIHLAHPPISNERLLNFLAELGSDNEGLEPLEVKMFDYLKSVSNTEANIKSAIKGG